MNSSNLPKFLSEPIDISFIHHLSGGARHLTYSTQRANVLASCIALGLGQCATSEALCAGESTHTQDMLDLCSDMFGAGLASRFTVRVDHQVIPFTNYCKEYVFKRN